MRYFTCLLVSFSWALWFGGNIAVFVFISALFAERRDIAGSVGMVLFPTFERYAAILAAAALIGSFLARMYAPATRQTVLFGLLALAAALLCYSAIAITPHIARMFSDQLAHTPEFRKLHGLSMAIYCGQAMMLLLAGFLLPAVVRDVVKKAEFR